MRGAGDRAALVLRAVNREDLEALVTCPSVGVWGGVS